MRRRAPGAGNDRELRVIGWLQAWGWTCGSRRHIGGAGDILAARWQEDPDPTDPIGDTDLILVEVKSTAAGPYDHFLPADREAMRTLAGTLHATPLLAWWPARKPLVWVPEHEWPRRLTRVRTQLEMEAE